MIKIVSLSQLGGLLSNIFNFFLSWIIGDVAMWFFTSWYTQITAPAFLLIDGLTYVFKKFVGLGGYVYDNQRMEGDVVLSLINSPTVQNVFWSLLILAVVLLVVFTIVAIIKSETKSINDKNAKTKNMIFASAVKSLVNFFMVPVIAILGIFMGNALLKSLDKATNSNSSTISGMLFTACAYNANRARIDPGIAEDFANGKNTFGITGTKDTIADAIDAAFAQGKMMHSSNGVNGIHINPFDSSLNGNYWFWSNKAAPATMVPYFSIYNAFTVWFYYDIMQFNQLVFFISVPFILWVLLVTTIGLVKRIFKLVILLCVAPPIAALGPIDDGKALGKWQSDFIGETLSAYGTVVSLNLFLMLMGVVQNIEWFRTYTSNIEILNSIDVLGKVANRLVSVLILCGGLSFFKKFVKDLSDLIGAKNAYSDGAEAAKEIGKKVGKVATAVAAAYTGGASLAALKGAKAAKAAKQGLSAAKQGLSAAKNATKAAQAKYDAAKGGEGEGAAQAELNKAKLAENKAEQEEKDANVTWDKYKEHDVDDKTMNEYEKRANDMFAKAKTNFASAATNGLSDDVGYGDIAKMKADSAPITKRNKISKMKRKTRENMVSAAALKKGKSRKEVKQSVRDYRTQEKHEQQRLIDLAGKDNNDVKNDFVASNELLSEAKERNQKITKVTKPMKKMVKKGPSALHAGTIEVNSNNTYQIPQETTKDDGTYYTTDGENHTSNWSTNVEKNNEKKGKK